MNRDDEKWIQRTFELAEKGLPKASPNPYVGCVIVKAGKVVAEGAHLEFGGPHAEIAALRSAGKRARGATLYTNLEPCCHWGKTPPCTDAIISMGIARVVSAMANPNPLVKGDGFKTLKKAGISVCSKIAQDHAKDLNRSFIKFMLERRPYVFLKSAISLDGKIATKTGNSQWITSKTSRDWGHKLRGSMDAVLVGAQTVRKDNPSLTSHGNGRNPLRIVLTRSGRIPKRAKIFDESAETLVLKNLNWKAITNTLGQRGITRLLIEGGGETAAGALEAGIVDEVFYFIAPKLIGGATAKTSFEGKGISKLNEALCLSQVHVLNSGVDILVHGRMQH